MSMAHAIADLRPRRSFHMLLLSTIPFVSEKLAIITFVTLDGFWLMR